MSSVACMHYDYIAAYCRQVCISFVVVGITNGGEF